MNEASVNLLKQNNGIKEIFSNNFFLSTFQSYHPLRENVPYVGFPLQLRNPPSDVVLSFIRMLAKIAMRRKLKLLFGYILVRHLRRNGRGDRIYTLVLLDEKSMESKT